MAVYKRGNIWWYKFQVEGQEYRRSAGTTKKREAQAVERQERQEVAKRLHEKRSGKPTQRLYSEALIRWIESGAPKSMYSHARNTRPYLDDVPLHLVPAAANEMKRSMLRDGLKPTTINRRLAVVQRVLNEAYKEWDWLNEPLAQKIKKLSEKGMSREFYLSKEEVAQLVEAISHPVAKAMVTLAAYTGLRRGELFSLAKQHWQPPYIVLTNKTKSGKPRTVPVLDEHHELLEMIPFDISEHELRKAFEAAREAIQRPDIRFHDLRHTYASWLVAQPEMPLTVIRDLLGHSNLTVTSKYAHLRGQHIDLIKVALGSG